MQSNVSQNDSIRQLLYNTSLNIRNQFTKVPMVLYIGLRKWVLIERLLGNLSQEEYVIYSHMFKMIQDLVTKVETNKDTIKSLHFCNSWLEGEVNKKKCVMYKEQSLCLSSKIGEELNSIIMITEDLQSRVITFLILWQSNEVCVRKGLLKSNTFTLDIIQCWFEQLTDVLWNTREQVKTLISEFQENSINEELNQKVDILINQLISHAFIVEEQPSLVLRTKTK